MTRENKATPVLQLFDIERGKGGSGDKQKVFVVKTRGAKRICLVIFLFFIGIGCYIFNTQWELQIIKRDIVQEKGEDAVKEAIVQERMVALQTELESQLVSAIKERQDAEATAKTTTKMMQKAFAHNMKFVEFELDGVRESASNILGQLSENDWFTEKLLELFADERADNEQGWLRNELKQVTQPFQEELLHVLEKMQNAFMELHNNLEKDMRNLVDMQTLDQRKHGDEAKKRLSGISENLRRSALDAAAANSIAGDILAGGRYPEPQMRKMLHSFFQHAHSRNMGDLDAIGFRPERFAEVSPPVLNKLRDIFTKYESKKLNEDEVKKLLLPMIKKNEIPAPNDPGMTLFAFIESLLNTGGKFKDFKQKTDAARARQKKFLSQLFQHEKEWNQGKYATGQLFAKIQQHLKSKNIPINWLLEKEVHEKFQMIPEIRNWLGKRYEAVSTGKVDKRKFYSELMDLYQEGKIPYDVMSRITKSLAQFGHGAAETGAAVKEKPSPPSHSSINADQDADSSINTAPDAVSDVRQGAAVSDVRQGAIDQEQDEKQGNNDDDPKRNVEESPVPENETPREKRKRIRKEKKAQEEEERRRVREEIRALERARKTKSRQKQKKIGETE